MEASPAAYALIREFEGVRLEAYCCPAGVLTIGYGSTKGVKAGMKITQAQADKRLANDVAVYVRGVNEAIRWPLNQNQFDALVSFAFNVGVNALKNSTMAKLINAGDISAASNEFARWNKAGGKVLEGLSRRRAAERRLFLGQATKG